MSQYTPVPWAKFVLLAGAQVGVFVLCRHFFELYLAIVLLSIGGLSYIRVKRKKFDRILELTVVETWFITLLYIVFFIGQNQLSCVLLLVFFFFIQAALFLRATWQVRNYRKFIVSLIHGVPLCYLILANGQYDAPFADFPRIVPSEFNDYYRWIYLLWVIPFIGLFTGDGFAPVPFFLLQVLSLSLSFAHDDFLSMRLFTAQITFIGMGVLRVPLEPRMTKYFPSVSKGIETTCIILLAGAVIYGFYIGFQ